MFSSLKLNSLKCQSNGESEKKKDKCDAGDEEDDLSDHMYEKLPNADNKPCKCHKNFIARSPKSQKVPFTRRISKCKSVRLFVYLRFFFFFLVFFYFKLIFKNLKNQN